jgi:DNA-binding transcriptional LysR family regulator
VGAQVLHAQHRIGREPHLALIRHHRALGIGATLAPRHGQTRQYLDREIADVVAGEPAGRLAIASVGLWVHALLPGLLAELTAARPRVVPRLTRLAPADVMAAVAAGTVELGLLLDPPDLPGFAHRVGLETPYVIAGCPQPERAWDAWGYVVPRRSHGAPPRDGWPVTGHPRRVVMEVDMLETAVSMCEAGIGVAFLPALAIRRQLAEGRLAVVAVPPVAHVDTLHLIWREGRRLSSAAALFVATIEALA